MFKPEAGSGTSAQTTPEKSELLSEKEAHQGYLMMRYKLGMDKDGKIGDFNKETGEFERVFPSKEDLDKAYEAISEIIKLAEEEPDTKKFLYALGRILNGTTMVSTTIIAHACALSTYLMFPMGKGDRTQPAQNIIEENYKYFKGLLVDEQVLLDRYRKKAEKYA